MTFLAFLADRLVLLLLERFGARGAAAARAALRDRLRLLLLFFEADRFFGALGLAAARLAFLDRLRLLLFEADRFGARGTAAFRELLRLLDRFNLLLAAGRRALALGALGFCADRAFLALLDREAFLERDRLALLERDAFFFAAFGFWAERRAAFFLPDRDREREALFLDLDRERLFFFDRERLFLVAFLAFRLAERDRDRDLALERRGADRERERRILPFLATLLDLDLDFFGLVALGFLDSDGAGSPSALGKFSSVGSPLKTL